VVNLKRSKEKIMKKIVLKEDQVDKLMNKIVSEQFLNQGKYEQEVKCSFGYHNITYKGTEIDWIPDVNFKVFFDIDMEARSYGINNIGIYRVRGPEEIELEVTYYADGSDEPIEEEVRLRLDWSNVDVERDANIGWIGLDSDMEIELTNREDGSFAAVGITVHSKEI